MNWKKISEAVNLAFSISKTDQIRINLSLARKQKDEIKAAKEAKGTWEKKLEDSYSDSVRHINELKAELLQLQDKFSAKLDKVLTELDDDEYSTFEEKAKSIGVEFD